MHTQEPLHNTTPIVESFGLNQRLGKRIFFKMDAYQIPGSFKIRGIGHLCQILAKQGAKRFVSASGGNAGCAAAYAGRLLGVETQVLVPKTTTESMKKRIRDFGATVEVVGEVWDETDAHARKVAQESSVFYIPPFDHHLIWEGHASIVEEAKSQMPQPDAVVVAVGGGGLLCGVMQGLVKQAWTNTQVFSAETEGAASFAAALRAQELVKLEGIDSVASSLGAKQVAQAAFDWSQKYPIIPVTMSDKLALEACKWFVNEFGVLVEPACGAALSTVYHHPQLFDGMDNILVIVCGGRGMDWATFNTYCERFGIA